MESQVLKIEEITRTLSVPIVLCKSYGFIGFFRILLNEHVTVEPHVENFVDLRLDSPWEEFVDYVESFDFENLDSMGLAHVPFPVLILRALKKWNENYSRLPNNNQEKKQFNEYIDSLFEKKLEDDENIQEAKRNSHRLFSATKIPSDIISYFNDPRASNIDSNVI